MHEQEKFKLNCEVSTVGGWWTILELLMTRVLVLEIMHDREWLSENWVVRKFLESCKVV